MSESQGGAVYFAAPPGSRRLQCAARFRALFIPSSYVRRAMFNVSKGLQFRDTIRYSACYTVLVQWLISDFLLWKGNCETARRRKSNSSAKECFRVAFSSLHFLLSFYIIADVIKCGVWLRFRYVHSYMVGCDSCN
jgi:hypothetical protein